MVVADLVLHGGLVLAVEDDARATFPHVVNAAILKRRFALARLEVLEAIVEQHGAAFVVGDHLNVVGDVSSNESCEIKELKHRIILQGWQNTVGVDLGFRVVVVVAKENRDAVGAIHLDPGLTSEGD